MRWNCLGQLILSRRQCYCSFFILGIIQQKTLLKKTAAEVNHSIRSPAIAYTISTFWLSGQASSANSASASDCRQLLPEGQCGTTSYTKLQTLQEMRCWSVTRRVSFSRPKDVKATKLAVCQTFLNLNVCAVSVLSRAVANSYIQSIREETGKEEWKDPYDSEK